MARFRTLKPETFSDEKLTEVSRDCRLLFIGLWCFVDDMGRKAYEPRRMQLELFPSDKDLTPRQVDKWARELERVDVIRFYKVDGVEYLWIPHFLRHQRIDRPSHSIIPPHPDDPEPDCCCANCRVERGEIDPDFLIRYGGKSGKPKFPPHNYARRQKTNLRNVPGFTRRVDESSTTRGALGEASGCSKNLNTIQNQEQNQIQQQEQDQPPENSFLPGSDGNGKDRPARHREVEEIAKRMILLLELKLNSQLLLALSQSIKRKARSKQCSEEAAAQQIAARAAFVASESPPEDWNQWFEDAGYEYFPEDDERLRDRHIQGRAICGGPLCSEGWETVKVNNVPVLRRCPDCAKLWED